MRQRILEHAQALFVAHGPSAVSLNRLCREMRIAKKTFYLHFDDKADLVQALVHAHMEAYARALVAGTASSDAPVVRLKNTLRAVLAVSARSFSAVYLRDLEADHPGLWARVDGGRHAMLTVVHGHLVQGQAAGAFRDDLSSEELLAVLTLLVDRVLDPAVLAAASLEPARVAEILVQLFFEGLQAPP